MDKKLLLLAVALAFLAGSVALALDPMGAPAASLGKGGKSVGLEWSWSDMTIERNVASPSDGKKTAEIDPMNKFYANLSYGIADNVDGFVRLGMGSADSDIAGSWTWEGDGDYRFIWGFGVKMTLAEQPGLKWGVLAQYGWGNFVGDKKGSRYTDGWEYDTGSYKIQLDEIQIAAGPTWSAAENIKVYGGPFIHWVRGQYRDYQPNRWANPAYHSIQEEGWLGGYLGLSVDLAKDTSLGADYMLTDNADALAVSLSVKF